MLLDFVPPTELDEVYAQFNTDESMGQLRQRIREGMGPADNIGPMLDVFRHHIDSVFEASRSRSGGVASSRRRLRIHTSRQMASRRSSVLLTPTRQGSGRSESSVSPPAATPHRTNMLGNLDQPLMVGTQSHMQYVPPTTGGYPIGGVDSLGGIMLDFLSAGNVSNSQPSQPIPVPLPMQVHLGFGNQHQNMASTLGGQHGHGQQPRLLPTESGLAVNTSFPGQRTASFSSVLTLESQNDYSPMDFRQGIHNLSLRPPPSGMQGVQGQEISPTDPIMVPSLPTPYHNIQQDLEDDGYEVV